MGVFTYTIEVFWPRIVKVPLRMDQPEEDWFSTMILSFSEVVHKSKTYFCSEKVFSPLLTNILWLKFILRCCFLEFYFSATILLGVFIVTVFCFFIGGHRHVWKNALHTHAYKTRSAVDDEAMEKPITMNLLKRMIYCLN